MKLTIILALVSTLLGVRSVSAQNARAQMAQALEEQAEVVPTPPSLPVQAAIQAQTAHQDTAFGKRGAERSAIGRAAAEAARKAAAKAAAQAATDAPPGQVGERGNSAAAHGAKEGREGQPRVHPKGGPPGRGPK